MAGLDKNESTPKFGFRLATRIVKFGPIDFPHNSDISRLDPHNPRPVFLKAKSAQDSHKQAIGRRPGIAEDTYLFISTAICNFGQDVGKHFEQGGSTTHSITLILIRIDTKQATDDIHRMDLNSTRVQTFKFLPH